MVRPWSPPLSHREESPSPLNFDDLDSILADFDPVQEWLIDPDQFFMLGDEAKVPDPSGLDPNKVESTGPLDTDDFATKRSYPGAKEEILCSSIDERMKNVSLVEGSDGNANNVMVLEGAASDKIDAGEANVTVVSSGAGDSKERDEANGCTALTKANGANEAHAACGLVKDEESSGTESDGSEGQDDDSDSSDSSSSSSSEEEDVDKCQDDDDDDDKSDSNSNRGRGIDAEGEIEEGEIRDTDREEMLIGSEEEEEVVKGPIKSKNEVEDLPPVPKIEVLLEPHHRTLPVGVISAMLDNKVIVEGLEKHNPLNEGSILWITEMRVPLGFVDEIFGPVKNPFYVVRYNSDKEVPAGISVGTAVSFVMEFATCIINHKELCKKAYDASGENDEELNEEVEFSDDEKEVEYKKSLRLSKRENNDRQKGNQQSFVNKRKFRGASIQKDIPPAIDRVPDVVDWPLTSVAGPVQPPVIAGSLGCSDYGSFGAGNTCVSSPSTIPVISLAAQMSNSLGLLPQQLQQQLNALWLNGLPHQQQQHIGLQGGFPVNMLPGQQLVNQAYTQLHQNQFFNSFPTGMPFQQQFIPSIQAPANIPWLGGLMRPSIAPPGSMWSGDLGQETSGNMQMQGAPISSNEHNFGRPPLANAPRPQRPPRNLGRGRTYFRGKKPHHRGGYHSYGRGS
ncbi:hypothetical protein OPV22_032027 [Ensete ventricosum]|uniref:H/ACA ribonucleoprotein complex non-core subunit NAF1 n=1 Tax=Ensete ventricosum TaxID=4639 RepID=A0AAV8NZR3_ENSVE|nr:hypothetical protein OPV22_032027 [Ensete ventricosum]